MPLGLLPMCGNQQKNVRDFFMSVCQMLRGSQGRAGAGKCKLQNAGMGRSENGVLVLLMWRPLLSVGVSPFLFVGI